jgi:catechol 2,3-dioxygenase-like lactoylglutathione lyase family enzyme
MSTIETVHHVALTVPTEGLEEARRFYSGLLGLKEASRPAAELGRPGIWYSLGDTELHIQCRDNISTPPGEYHPGLIVDDVRELRAHLQAGGVEIIEAQPLNDRERFFCRDPFGNRIEFLSRPDQK